MASGRGFAPAERFETEMRERRLKPAYVLVGDEAFFRRRCREAILRHLIAPEQRDFALRQKRISRVTPALQYVNRNCFLHFFDERTHRFEAARKLRGIAAQCQPSACNPRCNTCSRAETRLCSRFTERRAQTASRLRVYSSDSNHGTPAAAHSERTASGVRNEVQ